MSHQSILMRNKILFRILKSKGKDAAAICEKMALNLGNISILSEDELCELWYQVKIILLEAQKLSILQSDSNNLREYQQALNLIRTIISMALKTILQRTFVPNVLLEIVIILHSIILPEIKDEKVKDEMSFLLENWWKSNMIWKEKVIINTLNYLIQRSAYSLKHVKRLHGLKSALYLIKSNEDLQELFKLTRNHTCLSIEEGKAIILHLFTLGEQYIMEIYKNTKLMLESDQINLVNEYADLYAKAWLNTAMDIKRIIGNCLQDIIFHCFRIYRDSKGPGKLGKNIFAFLQALCNNKNVEVKNMVQENCKVLLWKHLKAPGPYVRCNAADIFFIIYPLKSTYSIRRKSNFYICKQYNVITNLLKDSNEEVRLTAITGVSKILEKYWSDLPNNIIEDWFDILLNYMCSSSPEIQVAIIGGIKQMMSNRQSHSVLKEFLQNLSNNVCTTNLIEILIKLSFNNDNTIQSIFFDVIPLPHVLEYLESANDISILKQLIQILWLRVLSNDVEYDEYNIIEKIIDMGIKNINATRRFFFHSKQIIKWNIALKLVKSTLIVVEKQMKSLSMDNKSKDRSVKKIKEMKKNEQRYQNDNIDINEHISILLEVTAILLIVNNKDLKKTNCNSEEKNLIIMISNILAQLFNSYKKQEILLNESVMYFLSLISITAITDGQTISQTILKQLHKTDVSDDVIITVFHTLLKWGKIDLIFAFLIQLLTESMTENSSTSNIYKVNHKTFKLSLRLLKQLLHDTFQSVLITEYYHELCNFWTNLIIIRNHIEQRLEQQRNINHNKMEVIVDLFKEYISLTILLQRNDTTDAPEYFVDILLWIKRKIILHLPSMDNIEKNQLPVNILSITLNASNSLVKEHQISAKLYRTNVILYIHCTSLPSGIIFANEAFNAINTFLELNRVIQEEEEFNLCNIALLNLLSAMMIMLTKYTDDVVNTYTNDLKLLPRLIHKYFSTVKYAYKNSTMHISYMTIILNTAISCLSKKLNSALKEASEDITNMKFPYLTEKILKLILQNKNYKNTCLTVIKKAMPKYSKIDMLSILLIVYRSSNLSVDFTQDIALTVKVEYDKRIHHDSSHRLTHDKITELMNLIRTKL